MQGLREEKRKGKNKDSGQMDELTVLDRENCSLYKSTVTIDNRCRDLPVYNETEVIRQWELMVRFTKQSLGFSEKRWTFPLGWFFSSCKDFCLANIFLIYLFFFSIFLCIIKYIYIYIYIHTHTHRHLWWVHALTAKSMKSEPFKMTSAVMTKDEVREVCNNCMRLLWGFSS